MIFGVSYAEKIWHQQLVYLPTSPVYCSHFTLGNSEKSFFNSIIHTHFRLFTLSQKKQTATVVLQLSVYLLLFTIPIICVALFYGQFLSLWSVIIKTTNATHNRLFSESPTFWGTQHYLQSHVKVLILHGSAVTFFRCGGRWGSNILFSSEIT